MKKIILRSCVHKGRNPDPFRISHNKTKESPEAKILPQDVLWDMRGLAATVQGHPKVKSLLCIIYNMILSHILSNDLALTLITPLIINPIPAVDILKTPGNVRSTIHIGIGIAHSAQGHLTIPKKKCYFMSTKEIE